MKSKRKVRFCFRKSGVSDINEYMQKHCLRWGKKRHRTDRVPVSNERTVKDSVPVRESRLIEVNVTSDLSYRLHVLETGNEVDIKNRKEYRRAAILRWKAKKMSRISGLNVSVDHVLDSDKKVDIQKKKANRKTSVSVSVSVSKLKKKSLSTLSKPSVSSDRVLETGKERRNVFVLKLKKQNVGSDRVLETGKEVDIPKKKEDKKVFVSKLKKRRLCDLSEPNVSSDRVLKRGKRVVIPDKKDDKKASASASKLKTRRVSRPSKPKVNSVCVTETGNEVDLQKKKEGRKVYISKSKKRKLSKPSEPNINGDRVLEKVKEVDIPKNNEHTKASVSRRKKRRLSKPSESDVNGDLNCASRMLETSNVVNIQNKKEYRRAAILRWKKKRSVVKASEPNINSDPNCDSRVLKMSNEVSVLSKKEYRRASILRWKKKRLSRLSDPIVTGDPNDSHVLETGNEVNLLKKKDDKEASISRKRKKRLSRPSEPHINSNEVYFLNKKEDREASVTRLEKKRLAKPSEPNINGGANRHSVLGMSNEVSLVKEKESETSISRLSKPTEPNVNGDPDHEVYLMKKKVEAFISRLKKNRVSRPSAPSINVDPHRVWPHLYETCDDVNPLMTKENRRASILRWKTKKLTRQSQPNVSGDTNFYFHELEKRKEVIRLKKKEYRRASILRWKKKRPPRLPEPTISCDPTHPRRSHVRETSNEVNLLKRKEYGRVSLSRWKKTRLSRPSEPNISIDRSVEVVNVVAPRLANFSIRNCIEEHVISVADIASLLFRYSHPLWLHTDDFRYLVKVNVCVFGQHTNARQIVCLLQQLHSLKLLAINSGIFKILPSSMELISYQPCPFANLTRLKIYPDSLSMLEHPNEKTTMSTKVKNYVLENSPSTIFTMVSNEDIRATKNAISAENFMRKLNLLLVQWKADSDISVAHTPEQGNAQPQTEKQLAKIERHWDDLNEQMVQGKRKTSRIISMSRKIVKLLTNVPPSQRASLQVRFLSLCVEAYITMKIAIENAKIQLD